MKISAVIAIVATFGTESVMGASLVDRHVKSMTNTQLFPGKDFGIIVDATEKCAAEGLDSYGRPFGFADLTNSPSDSYVKPREDRYRGMSWLGAPFLREMQEFAGVDLASPDVVDTSDDDVFYKMRTTHIVKSSLWHIDVIEGSRQGFREPSWPVGFYFLNDNPDAFFEFDDDELCIPIVKGNFITFDGQKRHHTVVTDGFVDLLGPFDLKGAKCVLLGDEKEAPDAIPVHFGNSFSGTVKGVKRRRNLNEEGDIEKIITGQALYSIFYDGVTNEITENMLAYDITGFPRCNNNCNISVALSTSQECTKETYDDASFVPLLDALTYNTDEEGSTGVNLQSFNVNSENPTGEQLLAFLKNMLENPTQAQELNLSTFFYDEEGELVACSFLQPVISDEMKALAKTIIDLVGSMIGNVENDTTAPVVATDGGSSAGGISLLSLGAVGLSIACVLVNA